MLPVLASLACVACVVALLAALRRGSPGRVPAKLAASACFVAVPLAGGAAFGRYEGLVLAGLVLGAFGDAALLGKSRRALLVGLLFFLAGHLAYVLAFVPESRASGLGLGVG
ncbi:MAG: lysoplasmalogenase family protein, partial [Myxococcota bacterium]